MGKIVVADESDVRKIVKEEFVNMYKLYLKSDLWEIKTKMNSIDNILHK